MVINRILKTILTAYLIIPVTAVRAQTTNFDLGGNQITVEGDLKGFDLTVDINAIEDNLQIATLRLTRATASVPPQLSLKWNMPSSNIAGYWSTASFTNKTIRPDWSSSKVKSMLAREAPVIALYGHDDTNQSTFALSEALNTVTTSTSVREEDGMIYNAIEFFNEPTEQLANYEVELRFDKRPLPYSEVLRDVGEWWASFEQYTPLSVPEVAKLPVYSTWYSYHQNVTSEAILKECRVAKQMGFESIIIDDGWQTLDGNRGYAYTGDWEPERLPEMKELVQQVHDLGMKLVLWYAVPFVGEKSKVYDQMEGKFLRYWDGQGAYVLDPRFPEVRKFIIQTYVTAVNEWDLDGFKLDFIARFSADENTDLRAIDGRDFASVNAATDVLMTDLVDQLKEIKPDIMIEFRQPYSGPAMRKYGNMLRAADCPNLAMINRVRTTDLRLISGSTAVHSDMLMWHYDEPVEAAALQLLNVLFSVPQISVRLEDIPKTHFDMIKFYTNYWLQNREILLDGEFHAVSPLVNYPMITGWSEEKKITAVFEDLVIPIGTDDGSSFDLINAKSSQKVIIDITGYEREYEYTVSSCLGEVMNTATVRLTEGVHAFEVPASGLISFVAID